MYKRTIKQKIFRLPLYFILAPQVIYHKLKGINYKYDFLTSFFRYFPFGKINTDNSVTFKFKKKKIKFYYDHQNPLSAGIFGNKEYSSLDVNDSEVIDIGAALADTAIYFALRGAKKVYGYEVNKKNYDVAIKNVKINDLSEKIKIYHSGISDNKIKKTDILLGAVMIKDDYSSISSANFKTLNEIVFEKKINDGVLKIDVDGYEYKILNSTSKNVLRKFKFIFIEFHFGLKNLKKILEDAKFTVDVKFVTTVHINYHPKGFQNMEIGYILATRI